MKNIALLPVLISQVLVHAQDSSKMRHYAALQISPIATFNDYNKDIDQWGFGISATIKSYRLVSLQPSIGISIQEPQKQLKYYNNEQMKSFFTAEIGETLNLRVGKYLNLRASVLGGVEVKSYRAFSNARLNHETAPMLGFFGGLGTSAGRFDFSLDFGTTTYLGFHSYTSKLNLAYIFNKSDRRIHPVERKNRLTLSGKRNPEIMAECFILLDPDLAASGQGFRVYLSNNTGKWTLTPGIGINYIQNHSYTFQTAGIDLSCSFERNYSKTFSWKMGTTVGTYAGRMFPGAIPVYEFLYTGPSICHEKLRFSFDIGLAHFENLYLFGKLGFGVRL